MLVHQVIASVVASAVLSFAPCAQSQDLQRGLRNYQEVIAGRKKIEQLSVEEKREVLIIFRRVKARSNAGKSSECRDAQSRAESAASDLADQARRLKSCAESEDYSEDCSSEFRRTKNAHSEYEDAVSAVNGSCS